METRKERKRVIVHETDTKRRKRERKKVNMSERHTERQKEIEMYIWRDI